MLKPMINNRSKVQHCDNDHYCCQQSKVNQTLTRTVDNLKEQIIRLQK
jgi:hypothetical protein